MRHLGLQSEAEPSPSVVVRSWWGEGAGGGESNPGSDPLCREVQERTVTIPEAGQFRAAARRRTAGRSEDRRPGADGPRTP